MPPFRGLPHTTGSAGGHWFRLLREYQAGVVAFLVLFGTTFPFKTTFPQKHPEIIPKSTCLSFYSRTIIMVIYNEWTFTIYQDRSCSKQKNCVISQNCGWNQSFPPGGNGLCYWLTGSYVNLAISYLSEQQLFSVSDLVSVHLKKNGVFSIKNGCFTAQNSPFSHFF